MLQTPAPEEADAQSDRIAAWLDYACFDYPPDEGLTLVEFYYALLRHEMTFAYSDTGYVATAYIWIEVTEEDGAAVDTLHKRIVTGVKSPEQIGKQNIRIADQIQTALKPGTYIAQLIIEDAESQIDGSPMTGKVGVRKLRIRIPEFDGGKMALSGIELAYRIQLLPTDMQPSEYRPIDKSSRRIVPNPSRIFVNSDSVMYFYAEVYNLAFGIGMNREFSLGCKILDTHGGIVSDFGQRRQFKPGSSAIVSSALDIHDLPEGIYSINLEVTDAETNESATSSKPFQLLPRTTEIVPGIPVDSVTENDIEYLEKIVKYHLTREQKTILKELSLDGKRRFFEDFWRRNDPDPSSRLNEFKVELFRRFEYANQHYSVSIAKKDDGWETDRGRVYIVYGEPDEIERYPWTLDLKPFEKWNYFSLGSQGARFFIFEDETGYGDYRLAHSNAKGEPFDADWDERVRRGQLLNY
jgi:GWxTD domain-containing protein